MNQVTSKVSNQAPPTNLVKAIGDLRAITIFSSFYELKILQTQ